MALYGRSIWNDFTITLRQGNVVLWLIAINLGIFILQAFVGFDWVSFYGGSAPLKPFIRSYFYAPSNLGSLLYRPWTVLTYAFFHADFWHILFNLLYLYWFGRIFQVYHSEKRLLNLYLLGALAGSAFYIVSYNTFPCIRTGQASSLSPRCIRSSMVHYSCRNGNKSSVSHSAFYYRLRAFVGHCALYVWPRFVVFSKQPRGDSCPLRRNDYRLQLCSGCIEEGIIS